MQAITEDETDNNPAPLPSFSNSKSAKGLKDSDGARYNQQTKLLSPNSVAKNNANIISAIQLSPDPAGDISSHINIGSALSPSVDIAGRRSQSNFGAVPLNQQPALLGSVVNIQSENVMKSRTSAGKNSVNTLGTAISSEDSLNSYSNEKLNAKKAGFNPFAPPTAFSGPGQLSAANLFTRRGSATFSLSSIPTGRRQSMSAPGRRGSIVTGGQTRQMFDEDQLKYFWANRGVTIQDIDVAFNMLSQDKQKLTHADIKLFVSTYFDSFPEEAMSVLNSWKEEVTKAQLEDVLLNKQLMSSPYESAFKWFQPENGSLGKAQLKKIVRNVNPRKMPGKGDVKAILAKYDNDRDNMIGLEDFKKMGLY